MAAGVELRSGGQHVSQTLPVQVFASPQGHAPFISAYKACTHRSYFKSDQEQYNCTIMELLPLEAAIHGQSGEHVGFPGGPVVKNLPASSGDAGDLGSIPGWGRSLGGENGNRLQDSCLEKPMDRGAWRATVHGVTRVGQDLAAEHTHMTMLPFASQELPGTQSPASLTPCSLCDAAHLLLEFRPQKNGRAYHHTWDSPSPPGLKVLNPSCPGS